MNNLNLCCRVFGMGVSRRRELLVENYTTARLASWLHPKATPPVSIQDIH